MTRHTLFDVLDILKFMGILLLVLMFIHFNTTIANQAQETQNIAASTNRVVKSQGDILKAIKQVTDDTHITAAQQTAIIICMLQVPINQRTPDLQAQCRSQSIPSPTGSPAKTATPVTAQNPPTPTQQGSGTKSEQPTQPVSATPQPSVVKRVEKFLGLTNLKFQ